MANNLAFYGWQRSGLYSLAGTQVAGRLEATVEIILRDRNNPADFVTKNIQFKILGPRDASGLQAGAIARRVPPPGVLDAETTKCVHVDFNAVDLPWRLTPEIAAGKRLRPWIVLVVGTMEEITVEAGGMVTLAKSVTDAHDLAQSARWAHVQDDGAQQIARLLSPRLLMPKTEHIAAIVPAFAEDGSDLWNAGTTSGITLPAYDMWRFATEEGGDFVTIAARLEPEIASPDLGRAPMSYTRTDPETSFVVRGALAPIGGTDTALPEPVATDMAVLTTPLTDPKGRPVIGLPRYGDAWKDDPESTTWGATVNGDPRHRGTGGLGMWGGIELQQPIVEAAESQAGALGAAAQRIRHLTWGLEASRSLWRRRLPSDPSHRLLIYGPSLRRMQTANGTILNKVAGDGRPLPPAIFSSAARRVLRAGPARTDWARPRAAQPFAVLRTANTCPPPPNRNPDGLPHPDRLDKARGTSSIEESIELALKNGRLPHEGILSLINEFDTAQFGPRIEKQLQQLFQRIFKSRQEGFPHQALVDLLDMKEEDKQKNAETIQTQIRLFDVTPDDASLLKLGSLVVTRPPDRPCKPVDLLKLEAKLTTSIDPTVAEPVAVQRVLSGISGLDDQPLTPPEVCMGIDLPVWRFLRDFAPDWLLPGVGQLKDDRVIGMESNPAFIDAFLLGINTQALSEFRWRNIPVATGCTPLRRFWGRIDAAVDRDDDDIIGILNWPDSSALGSSAHQIPSSSGTDLVLVFRSALFHRYPQTIVYAVPAQKDGTGNPDWSVDPDPAASRLFPTFQGSIGEDITFFGFDMLPADALEYWIVLEEPPPGYRFRNTPAPNWDASRVLQFNNAADGADFADAAFNDPTRVLIRGESIIPVESP